MALADKKLTDLAELVDVPSNAWIHIVDPSNISQSPEGSSFKARKENFVNEDLTASHYRGKYNAATNTPTLVDGTGQIGDYWEVNVPGTQDFGSGSMVLKANDWLHYNGIDGIWQKWINNSQAIGLADVAYSGDYNDLSNLPDLSTKQDTLVNTINIKSVDSQTILGSGNLVTVTTPVYRALSSSDLTSVDVTGFVAYVNELSPILTLATNEVAKFLVTDTGRIYELKLNGRSFGLAQAPIVNNDVLDFNNGILNSNFIWNADVYNWQATGGAISLYGSLTPTTVGTGTNVIPDFTSSYSTAPNLTWMSRKSASAASAGSMWEFYEASKRVCSVGLGFYFSTKIAVNTSAANDRYFFGLKSSVSATTDNNPTTLLNIVGFGKDLGETTMHIIHNDGSGTATSVNLGASFPLNANNISYHLEMWNFFGSNNVICKITYLNTMATTIRIITNGDVPATIGTGLSPHLWGSNGTTASSVVGQWSHLTILTPN